jgi:hypothetical protein
MRRSVLVFALTLSLAATHPTLLAAPPVPKNAAHAPATTDKPQVEAKFALWGLLVNAVTSAVFSAFRDWLIKRVFGDAPPTALASDSPAGSAQTLGDLKTELTGAAIANVSDTVAGGMTRLLDALFAAKSAPLVAQPKAALVVKDGAPNYQAAHVAVIGADRDGKLTGLRPVSEGFRSGERIKLRIATTYDGLLTITNINPDGVRRQIYPPAPGTVVQLPAGKEVLIPLGRDEYFEFAGVTGTEQLVVTIVDPRGLEGAASAIGASRGPRAMDGAGAASRKPVYREDVAYGSNFAQQVEPGTYPVISQAMALIHR